MAIQRILSVENACAEAGQRRAKALVRDAPVRFRQRVHESVDSRSAMALRGGRGNPFGFRRDFHRCNASPAEMRVDALDEHRRLILNVERAPRRDTKPQSGRTGLSRAPSSVRAAAIAAGPARTEPRLAHRRSTASRESGSPATGRASPAPAPSAGRIRSARRFGPLRGGVVTVGTSQRTVALSRFHIPSLDPHPC